MEGTVCPTCGHPNPPSATFCESCARRLPVGLAGTAPTGTGTPDRDVLREIRGQRRYLVAAIALGSVGLVLGATAFVLPYAVPGYAPSAHPSTPTVLFGGALSWRTCTATFGSNCTAATAGNRVVDVVIPGDPNTESAINLTVRMNRSCPDCWVVVIRDLPDDAPVFLDQFTLIQPTTDYLEAGFTNNSSTVGLLPGGIYDVVFEAYVNPYTGTTTPFVATANTMVTDHGEVRST
ncbi:MAG TPA: zinc ribbon domain-containing protein [Thermoplasmata archaeon]|nr:zinc ribbon domain-containing protein [Thermoplasmata archaeon]